MFFPSPRAERGGLGKKINIYIYINLCLYIYTYMHTERLNQWGGTAICIYIYIYIYIYTGWIDGAALIAAPPFFALAGAFATTFVTAFLTFVVLAFTVGTASVGGVTLLTVFGAMAVGPLHTGRGRRVLKRVFAERRLYV